MDERIVVVDDDPGTINLIGRILSGTAEMRFATSGETALKLMADYVPDLILLDAELPGMSGFKVFEKLRVQPNLAEVPVIFITSHHETGFEVSALNMGAVDFIAKPFQSSLVLARVQAQLRSKRRMDEFRRCAVVDDLTGLATRVRFDETLGLEWGRGLRWGDAIGLILIDVNNFDKYNDHHGQVKGNAFLQRIAHALSGITRRSSDLLSRCAGSQFGLLLPQTSRRGAEHIAHRILEAVEACGITDEGLNTVPRVTVSVGVACYDEASACWRRPSAEFRSLDDLRSHPVANNLLIAADSALLSAKRSVSSEAKFLDISDWESPHLSRNLCSSSWLPLRKGWAARGPDVTNLQ